MSADKSGSDDNDRSSSSRADKSRLNCSRPVLHWLCESYDTSQPGDTGWPVFMNADQHRRESMTLNHK
ncbi:hypothetical protein ABBQ32_004063 [Trebouxia sp. C0010 RCD-2024]